MRTEYKQIAQADMSGEWDVCGSSMVCSPSDIARKVFAADDYEIDYRGEMFAYLFRRFGYPKYGWDDYKDLVSYYLTTPDPDIVLWCKPSSGLWLSFGFGLRQPFGCEADRAAMTWRMQDPRTQEWEATHVYKRIESALTAAMSELMRPVYVRDVPYCLIGRADDNDMFTESAKRSPQAGYGVGDFDPTV